MSSLSDDIVTRITGYNVLPGNFSDNTPNLPVQIALFGQPNTANEATVDVSTPVQVTSIQQVASLYGWGSHIYQAAKELFPNIGGIPVWVYPQLASVGATKRILHVTAVGTATASGTHFVKLAGRTTVGGQSYSVNIVQGDTASIIHGKITDAVNNVLGAPSIAFDYDYYASLESKWKGDSADEITVSMDTGGNSLGITYSYSTYQSGAGTPDVSASLALFGNRWITNVINGYGLNTQVMSQFEAFNGVPVIGTASPSGRYLPTVFKPFYAHTGFVSADPSATTDTHLNQVTITTSPAPLSKGLSIEAAANDCLLRATCLQNTPHLDVIGQSYPDMPTPDAIGVMNSWVDRDRIVKKGCSTVDLVGGAYQIQDPVTTYHPIGEIPPQFRYTRNLGVDWNVRFTYMLIEQINLLNKVIANDNDFVSASNVIKPKQWKAIVSEMIENLVLRGLIVDAQFSIDSITVQISTVNPDRFQTTFKYKRSGVVRQSDTEATAGFNVGTLIAN